MKKRFSLTQRTLSGLALTLSAWAFQAPVAFAACECLCVDGAPYNVCTEGFAGQTQETTQSCTDALATECPVPDPIATTEPTAADSVNAAAVANGLDCKPRQVYRPDLGRHKVYTVCMPEKWANAQTKRAAKKADLAAARQERKGWTGNWDKQQRTAHSRRASWDWRDQEHWNARHDKD